MVTESIDLSSSSLRKSVYFLIRPAFGNPFIFSFNCSGSTSQTDTSPQPLASENMRTWFPPMPPVPITACLILSLGGSSFQDDGTIRGPPKIPALALPVFFIKSRRFTPALPFFSLSSIFFDLFVYHLDYG